MFECLEKLAVKCEGVAHLPHSDRADAFRAEQPIRSSIVIIEVCPADKHFSHVQLPSGWTISRDREGLAQVTDEVNARRYYIVGSSPETALLVPC